MINQVNILKFFQPNILGIGCAKCGTTSIAKLLSIHPDISVPKKKELHFFDEKNVNYIAFISYLKNFQPKKIRLEFTPSYIMDKKARFLIQQWLGKNTKFLVSLRNPVHRAYSHYWHARKNWIVGSKWVEYRGYPVENLEFEEAIKEEFNRLVFDPYHTRHLSYFAKGLYYQQIIRWLQIFPKENFHFIIFENLIEDFESELFRLEDFMKVDLKGLKFEKMNSQTESIIDSNTYNWLWKKYELDMARLERELELPISRWYR